MPLGRYNRLVWVGLVTLLAVLAVHTRDQFEAMFLTVGRLEVIDDGDSDVLHLAWRGRIEAPMAQRIREAIASFGDGRRRVVLRLHSPGGSLDHGAEVMELLQRIAASHELETRVEARGRCASMCVPVYLQGKRRTAAAGAQFMFHRVSYHEPVSNETAEVPEAALERATARFFERYFAPAGVPAAWITAIRAQMAEEGDVWKTAAELAADGSGIVQRVD